MADGDPLISLRGLETSIPSRDGVVRAVRGVSLDVNAGETVGLVGESGSGKTITALSITRLLPAGARIVAGQVMFGGHDLVQADERALRRVRGGQIAMVFQDSMTSLNPLLTIGLQISESLEAHTDLSGKAAQARAVALLEEVGISEAPRRLHQYPHQLSGGLRQRVAVAVALASNPKLLIADEPTTALDVTIQAQLLELLEREQARRGMALILITHDLGVVAGVADRVAVMYAGRIVELGSSDTVFARPSHPYTRALLNSVPRIDGSVTARLPSIPGAPPPLSRLPAGCPFRPRCAYAVDVCAEIDPPHRRVEPDHVIACHVDMEQA
jgi:oligopeptide/dipeptide ABC transporter ATP-binding protein